MRASLVTLQSGIDVGQGINVGLRKLVKNDKRRVLNKRNVCSVKKLTKRSSNTVLRLVSFSAEQTLPQIYKASWYWF